MSCQEAASGVKKDSQEKATGFWIFVTLLVCAMRMAKPVMFIEA